MGFTLYIDTNDETFSITVVRRSTPLGINASSHSASCCRCHMFRDPAAASVDGGWDSICMICYQTAATSVREPELGRTETTHIRHGYPKTLLIAQVPDLRSRRAD